MGDLFENYVVDPDAEEGEYIEYSPLSVISGHGPYDFGIEPIKKNGFWSLPKSRLYCVFKIMKMENGVAKQVEASDDVV